MRMSTNACTNLDEMPMMDLSSSFILDFDEPSTTHSSSDVFQRADDLARIFNILECAENVLSMQEPATAGIQDFDFSMEPTPIGPSGIQNVVSKPEIVPPSSVQSLIRMLQPAFMSSSAMEMMCNRPHKRQCVSHDILQPSPPKTHPGPSQMTQEFPQVSPINDDDRFRRYQSDQWLERFQDLVDFKTKHGHCLVPHNYPPNQQLAQWTKRQRYQYKLKNLGRHSTLTDDRELELENMGFVWNSHRAAWEERFEDLKAFCLREGHCNVPSNYEADKLLAVWVKCQRRQMKLYKKGFTSTMTEERMRALEALGFDWNPRNL